MKQKSLSFFGIIIFLIFSIAIGATRNINFVSGYNSNFAIPICTSATDQQDSRIIKSSDGNIIIAWYDMRNGNLDIYAQKLDPRGFPLWTLNGVPVCTADYGQFNILLVSDGQGGAILFWEDFRSGSGSDIYAQRIDSDGNPEWDLDGIVICDESGNQGGIAMCLEEYSGEIIIVWHDYRYGTGNEDIYGQRVAFNGTTLWNDNGIVICNATGRQRNPEVVIDNWGGAYVAWMDRRSGTTQADSDIYISRIYSTGEYRWVENGIAVCDATGEQTSFAMINGYIDRALISWMDNRSGDFDVYIQEVDASGGRNWGTNGMPISRKPGLQGGVQMCTDGNYGAILAWCDERDNPGTSIYDIYTQHVNASGDVKWADNGTLVCNADENQEVFDITHDGENGAILLWLDQRSPSETSLYTQRIQPNGSGLWGNNGTAIDPVTNVNQYWGEVELFENGAAIFSWQDDRNGDLDIWAQHYKDETPPTCTSPDDMSHIQGSVASIAWNLYDNAGDGGHYRVQMGIPEHIGSTVVVPWTEWEYGEEVFALIDTSTNGTFWYRIEFNDTFGNMGIMDTVFVTITLAPPTGPENWVFWLIGAIAVVAIGTTVGVIILLRKRKEVKDKHKN